MEIFTQSDVFIVLVGTAQIIIVVFLVFALALTVKILSDISYLTGRIKTEADEIFADVGKIKKEAKEIARAFVSYISALAKISGFKKAISIFSGLTKTKTKDESVKKPSKKRSSVNKKN